MTDSIMPLALGVLALSFLASGGALLVVRRALAAGLLLAAAGASMLVGAILLASDADASVPLALGCALLLPLALASYPVLRWRHPIDFLCLATLFGAGVAAVLWPDQDFFQATGLIITMVLIAHTWWRIERAVDRERRALAWMAVTAGSSALAAGLAGFATDSTDGLAVGLLLCVLVGPALYVGVSLPDIVDVRGLVVRAVVLAVAVVTYLAGFVLVAALLEELGPDPLSLGALGLVGAALALGVYPLQRLLRGTVDELLFGHRPDPLGAASQLADQLGDDPVDALRAIRAALVLPYAALREDGQDVAVSGAVVTHTRTFDLDGSGELVVGLRPGDLTFSAGEEQALRLTAPLLGQTLRARALAEELLESRGQTISAIEEERRRLRRDLHDGLGPRLSGVAFTADAARNLLRQDPAAAEELLGSLRAETTGAIEDVRRLVYGMRPPALDELGLLAALRQQAASLRTSRGEPLEVSLRAPADPPQLPAAVEVAAYRIVLEALTNVARHSDSAQASVDLCLTPVALTIDVEDCGTGRDAWQAGVGLASMRERAVELGGTLDAGPGPRGSRVSAVLPLRG